MSVARNEFAIQSRSPMVFSYVFLMLVLATTEALEASVQMAKIGSMDRASAFMLSGVGNPFFYTSLLTMFVAMCIGVMSVANDRSRGTIGVLITKPLYRRDVMLGKLAGSGAVLFLLSMLGEALNISLLLIFVGDPGSFSELILRAGSFAFLLFAEGTFTLALVMLFGILLSKAEALILGTCFLSIEWLTQSLLLNYILPGSLQVIDPRNLFYYATRTASNDLFAATTPYGVWLNNALPYIVLLFAEIVIIILIDCMAFNRLDA